MASRGVLESLPDLLFAFNSLIKMKEIIVEMYERLWNADKDKWAWNAILKDTLDKIETFNTNEK